MRKTGFLRERSHDGTGVGPNNELSPVLITMKLVRYRPHGGQTFALDYGLLFFTD